MNIIIACRGYKATASIKSYVENSIASHMGKYLQGNPGTSARVVLAKEAHMLTSCISICADHQEFVRTSRSADTVYKAIDDAAAHIASKLRKYKGEKIDRHRKLRSIRDEAKCKGYSFSNKEAGSPDIEDSRFITEEEISLKRMSVGEAAMELELMSVPALMFINAKTDKVNMVYAKGETIVCVDPLNVVMGK
ncbi:sigma 54 modulation/S30EA ribosomal C-terminal domain-containing protein [Anaplasma capra]|uniref:sigma 54 modulation/S30EA ribosomal C-terminal domain-containing protein n=1 Tax=Anaplasma capra TaxID=1562740 RepID=UPI0021D5745C|nr:sigma 54 modulation/S30EA ribosomal C-terminal domain-containing protein [Anaplasma capra]MCU7611632.1 sigma 54 modulation/S30EA ribosomal C-terminal domain-containing protein [Anaplasma capra]MCU7612220.1 sigma 54 modulation/S30EA ribosomal C-terminal domain-containing protein [Anaplasma capra]